MPEEPLVSVVMPMHDAASFVPDARRQVQALVGPTIEVVVVDDGFSEATSRLVDEWAADDPRVRIVRGFESKGVSQARNAGLAAASGRYVWFADCDDRWSPRILDVMVAAARDHDADVVVCGADSLRADGGPGSVLPRYESAEVLTADDAMRALLSWRIRGNLWNKLVDRRLYEGVSFPDVATREDLAVLCDVMVSARKVVLVEDVLYTYILHPRSLMGRTAVDPADLMTVLDRVESAAARMSDRDGIDADLQAFAFREVYLPVLRTAAGRSEPSPEEREIYAEVKGRVGVGSAVGVARHGEGVSAFATLLAARAPKAFTLLAPPRPAGPSEPQPGLETMESGLESEWPTGAVEDLAEPPRDGPAPGSEWRRRSVTLGDQVLSSISNVLAVVLVARVLSAGDFGVFSLSYSILTLVLAMSRSYFGTRVSLSERDDHAHQLTRDLLGALTLLTPFIVVAVLVVSWGVSGFTRNPVLLVVALATPVVLLQDITRFGAVASGRPWASFASDGVWVAFMLVPFALGDRLPAVVIMLLWLLAAVAALVVALVLLRATPDLRGGVVQLRTRHAVGEANTWVATVGVLGGLWVLFIASVAISTAASGSLRGASTIMGPLNVLLAFTSIGLTPMLVRRPRAFDIRFSLAVLVVLPVIAVVWGGILLVLPESFGTWLFGASWTGIHHVLPVTIVEYVFVCGTAAAFISLRVRGQAQDLKRMRVITGTFMFVVVPLVGFATHNVLGIAAVAAVSALLSMSVSWYWLLRARHQFESQTGSVATA